MTVNAYGTVRHRQFTGVQGGHLKWLPFPGADPHSDNPETHQIMILGSLQSEVRVDAPLVATLFDSPPGPSALCLAV